MIYRLLVLLVPLLLAASCQNTQPPAAPPAPRVAEPPHDLPFEFLYLFDRHGFNVRWRPEYMGVDGVNYLEAPDGSWRVQLRGVGGPGYWNPWDDSNLYTQSGCWLHLAQDVTPNRVFGGRRFRWRFCFRLHTESDPWWLEMPSAPPEFAVLDKLPWEERGYVSENPRLDLALWGDQSTTPVASPFEGCLQQAQDDHFYGRGLYFRVFPNVAPQFYQLQRQGPLSFTRLWAFFDYDAPGGGLSYRGVRVMYTHPDDGPMPVTVLTSSTRGYLNPLPNRTYRMVLFARGDGVGPYPKPWEKRWWRLWGEGFGAFDRGDRVECRFAREWHLDEVKDPAALAWLDGFLSLPGGEPPWSGAGTALLPALDPWR